MSVLAGSTFFNAQCTIIVHSAQCTVAVELFWEPPRRQRRHPSEGGEFFNGGRFLGFARNGMGVRVRNERGKRGAFLCSVEIAASRFALLAMTRGAFAFLAMTPYSFRRNSNDRQQRGFYTPPLYFFSVSVSSNRNSCR
ncbi:MAG: hypothetical protein LBL66_10960 [Clostridiales bacterium]|nr:hypothetical protein [Clostridiales bacterium]